MRRRHKKTYERHNVWRSYSDMMAGLLLLFVLVMCISFMQAQKNYQEKLQEEAAHQQTQTQLQAQLDERQSELDAQAALVASQQADLTAQSVLLAEQESELDAQAALVASQQADLDEQAALVASQQAALESQQEEIDAKNATLSEQESELARQEELMAEQQQKIEQIIGVKADLIAALKEEFDAENLSVTIDENDGSIALDSSILFGYDESELTEEGNSLLAQVLPIYCRVLMSEEYLDYLAEVRIDGYTDNSGDYFYNLQLSQERALAVADYLLSLSGSSISEDDMTELRSRLSVNGHSMSDLIYDSDGNIDEDASRRVEIKFRLKDEEMISELKQILDDSETAETSETDSE